MSGTATAGRRRARAIAMIAMIALGLAVRPSFTLAVPSNGVGAPASGSIPVATARGFRNARRPWAFVFPRDHAAHFGFETEWWYYTGHLVADDGREFGYELTFFRHGILPGDATPAPGESRWRGNQVFPVHLALTDVRGGRFAHDERFAREALGMGRASDARLDVHVGPWWLRGPAPFRMHASSDEVGTLDLTQRAAKPPAIHGHDGVSVKAACATCASHYYSMTRLETTGTLLYRGARLRVRGLSWMDHEFGSDELQSDMAGWDWFSIQLDDRREIMDYRLRRKDGTIVPESSGSLVGPHGDVRYLPLASVLVDVLGTWKSPHTAVVYPSGWRLRIPSARLDLTLTPLVGDQELANTTIGVSYWEGAVAVKDSASGRRIGEGYVELTGYAGAITF